jgi:nucleoside-diphosphate-sugar epimerase
MTSVRWTNPRIIARCGSILTENHSVLVTGATGFVGRALCLVLARRGKRVIAGLRAPGPQPAGAGQARVLGDLSRQPPLGEALAGVDAVVHLAGRAHVMRDASAHPEAAFQAVNTLASAHLARAARSAGVRRLVLLSTIKVNGECTDGRAPFCESDPPAPEDAYARSKLAAEQAAREIAQAPGSALELVILRPPLLHGPGAKGNLARLLRLIALGLPLPLAGIDNRRSLLGVTNLCDLIGLCLDHPAAAGETFLVADATLSTPELIRQLAAGLQRPARLFALPMAVLQGLARITGQRAALERLTGSLEINSRWVHERLCWIPPESPTTSLRQMAAARAFASEPQPAARH